MAQLNRLHKSFNDQQIHQNRLTSPRPSADELSKGDMVSRRISNPSHSLGREHSPEEDPHGQPLKKSILTKVKEKAKKLKHSLSNKSRKHIIYDDNSSPTLASLDTREDDNAEFFGAPMYESETAPQAIKETAKQHPRADPVIPEKHVLSYTINPQGSDHQTDPPNPNKTFTETVVAEEKLNPPANPTVVSSSNAENSKTFISPAMAEAAPIKTENNDDKIINATSDEHEHEHEHEYEHENENEKKWDKGVSVKEYLMQRLEPGEDEKALSRVISEAMSSSTPKRVPGDTGVLEKVKEAVTSLLRTEDSSPVKYGVASATSLSSFPVSTNADEVSEEENRGRILQTN